MQLASCSADVVGVMSEGPRPLFAAEGGGLGDTKES